MTKVSVLNKECDGYERLYTLQFLNSSDKIFAYGLDTEEYREGCDVTNSDEFIECSFEIEWVRDLTFSFGRDEYIKQPIHGSSHCECDLIIKKITDSDAFECFFENYGVISVELENDIENLKVGMKVSFNGNLKVNFV